MARLTVTQAAQGLGVSVDVIRRRVRKGDLTAQRDNRGQWWVEMPDDGIAPAMQGPDTALADAMRAQVADLIARLDSLEADRRSERAVWEAERGRLLALIEAMAAPRPAEATEAELMRVREALVRVEADAVAQRREMEATMKQAEERHRIALEAAVAGRPQHAAGRALSRLRRVLRALRGRDQTT